MREIRRRVLARARCQGGISPRLLCRSGEGWIPRRCDPGSIRRKRIGDYRGGAGNEGGRGLRRRDGGRKRDPSFDLWGEPDRLSWHRGTEAAVLTSGGAR